MGFPQEKSKPDRMPSKQRGGAVIARLLVALLIGLLNGIIWIWLASLVLSPTYAVAIGVVACVSTILVIAATQMMGEVDDDAPAAEEAASPPAEQPSESPQAHRARSAGSEADAAPCEREQ